MPAQVDQEKCDGCKTCEEACPSSAIKVGESNFAVCSPDDCIDCNACESECPQRAITMV